MEKIIEKLAVADLMKPRYKIIALWPYCDETVGTIYTPHPVDQRLFVECPGGAKGFILPSDKKRCTSAHYDQFPHLFRKLEWWQDRSIKEMPEFVKWVLWNEPQIEKVNSWLLHGKIPYADVPSQVNSIRAEYFEPATEQEYLTHSQAGER